MIKKYLNECKVRVKEEYYCMQCKESSRSNSSINFTFSRKSSLIRHDRSVHKKDVWTCNICNKEFSFRSKYEHKHNIDDKLFKCLTCNVAFSTKTSLRKHYKTIKHSIIIQEKNKQEIEQAAIILSSINNNNLNT